MNFLKKPNQKPQTENCHQKTRKTAQQEKEKHLEQGLHKPNLKVSETIAEDTKWTQLE
jgi:hypothetical protein